MPRIDNYQCIKIRDEVGNEQYGVLDEGTPPREGFVHFKLVGAVHARARQFSMKVMSTGRAPTTNVVPVSVDEVLQDESLSRISRLQESH